MRLHALATWHNVVDAAEAAGYFTPERLADVRASPTRSRGRKRKAEAGIREADAQARPPPRAYDCRGSAMSSTQTQLLPSVRQARLT